MQDLRQDLPDLRLISRVRHRQESPGISLIMRTIMKTMNMTIIMSMMRKAITKIRMQQRRLLPMKSQQKKHL